MLQNEEYLDVICGVVSEVFSVGYPQAFTSCGFNTNQEGISARVLNALQWSEVPIAGAGLPTLAELQQSWPGNGSRKIPVVQMFRPFLHEPRVPRGRITLRQAALCSAERSPTPPLHRRLRSSSRLSERTSAVAATLAASPAAPNTAAAVNPERCRMPRPMSLWMSSASRGPPMGRLLQRRRRQEEVLGSDE